METKSGGLVVMETRSDGLVVMETNLNRLVDGKDQKEYFGQWGRPKGTVWSKGNQPTRVVQKDQNGRFGRGGDHLGVDGLQPNP